jgi:hypothetical protein
MAQIDNKSKPEVDLSDTTLVTIWPDDGEQPYDGEDPHHQNG